jgi:hypothetical protein
MGPMVVCKSRRVAIMDTPPQDNPIKNDLLQSE